MRRSLDALVVGAGPVGLKLLQGLQSEGFRVAAVERAPPPAPPGPEDWDPRVYALSPSTIRSLQACGAWARIAPERRCGYVAMRVWSGDPAQAVQFRAEDVGEQALGAIVEHAQLIQALRAVCDPGVIAYRESVASLAATEAGVELRLDSGRRVHAALLIAADGADSATRRMAGLDTLRWAYGQTAVVCYLRTEDGHQHTAWQRFDGHGTLAFLPMADGRCSIVWSVPTAQAEALLALSEEAFAERCAQTAHGRLGKISAVERRYSFELRGMQAVRYAAGPVVLAGDAAHVVHPLAGQGVNLGLGDADELVRCLVEARARGRRLNHRRVLAAYERRRKARSSEMIAVTDGLHRAFGTTSPVLASLLSSSWAVLDRLPPLRRALIAQAISA